MKWETIPIICCYHSRRNNYKNIERNYTTAGAQKCQSVTNGDQLTLAYFKSDLFKETTLVFVNNVIKDEGIKQRRKVAPIICC